MSKEETLKHIKLVNRCIDWFINKLYMRGTYHDESKLHEPEVSIFDEYTKKLKGSTYGSDEYKQFLKEMKPALDHHYRHNRHHPEYYEDGVEGMSLIDVIEMFFDWVAASKRHDDGSIDNSIKVNKERFDLPPMLVSIFKNTAELMRSEDK